MLCFSKFPNFSYYYCYFIFFSYTSANSTFCKGFIKPMLSENDGLFSKHAVTLNCLWMTYQRSCGSDQPAICRMAGTANRLKHTRLLTGFPGSPKTEICRFGSLVEVSMVANVIGFPGFMWTCQHPQPTVNHAPRHP